MVAMNNGPDRQREQAINGENGNQGYEESQHDYAEMQRVYRQRYLEQLRRRSCPGCGESDIAEISEGDGDD